MLPPLHQELEDLKLQGLYRTTRLVKGPQNPHVQIDGRDFLLFCSNNYLGLANHPALKKNAQNALHTYGCSTVASALISGYMAPHETLETRLAEFLGTEAALTFPTGYMANLGAVTALVGQEDIIFSDALNHRSIIDACRLSRATVAIYPHKNTDYLNSLLQSKREYRRRLIITDGIFSMDGDLAPLPELVDLAQRHETILMVDDAHGTGVLGPTGRGTPEHFGLAEGIDVLMTAGSKALGTFGGFIAGTNDLIDLLQNRAAPFIYTTALPPDVCAATCTALGLADTSPDIRNALWKNIRTLRQGLKDLKYDPMESQTQIIPILIGDSDRTMAISAFLYDRGIYLSGIRPPTVPEGQSRLRLTLMASHSEEDIQQLLEGLAEVKKVYF